MRAKIFYGVSYGRKNNISVAIITYCQITRQTANRVYVNKCKVINRWFVLYAAKSNHFFYPTVWPFAIKLIRLKITC